MPPDGRPSPPFRTGQQTLALPGSRTASLEPLDAAAALSLAEAVARIDPWARLGIGADRLAAGLTAEDPHVCRRRIRLPGADAGLVVVRHPWLFGPYLNLLAVLPPCQGLGIGAAVLAWMEAEVAGRSGNLWVCVSAFNAPARAFYERCGFRSVGEIADLVAPGFSEVLMRKRLDAGGPPTAG
jgi:ribosomal protein S18 acetylase RimI-like enzyme